MRDLCKRENTGWPRAIAPDQVVLYSDNGSPMALGQPVKGAPMALGHPVLATLQALGCNAFVQPPGGEQRLVAAFAVMLQPLLGITV